MESKRDKFIRLAENRTNKIIHYIDLIGNLSNTKIYEYSESDIRKIFGEIESQIKITKQRFTAQNSKKRKFKL